MRLGKRCEKRLERLLGITFDPVCGHLAGTVRFTVERDEEMMFLAVWREDLIEGEWLKFPAFGLDFNPYMGLWTVWAWSEHAEFWEESDLPCDYETLDDAYRAACGHGLLWATPNWRDEEGRA